MFDNLIETFSKSSSSRYQLNLQIQTLLIGLIILFVLTFVYPQTYGFIIILVVFLGVVMDRYVQTQSDTLNDYNKTTMLKLQKLQQKIREYEIKKEKRFKTKGAFKTESLLFLYMDADLIHFLHSFLPMYSYNASEYYLLVKGVNKILMISKEIQDFYASNQVPPENVAEMFEIALELRTKTINNVHNFIYSVPKQRQLYKYIENAIEQYAYLIDKNINLIHTYYLLTTKQINSNTKFIYHKRSYAKPFENTTNFYN